MPKYLTVQHWKRGVNGNSDELAHVESFQVTEDVVEAPISEFGIGFVSPEIQTANFSDSNFLVVNYYYERAEFTAVVNCIAKGPRLVDSEDESDEITVETAEIFLKYGEDFRLNRSALLYVDIPGFEPADEVDVLVDGELISYSKDQTITQGTSAIIINYNYYPIKYRVDLNLAGDDVESPTELTYNALYAYVLPIPTRPEHNFEGWITSQGQRIYAINSEAVQEFYSVSDFLSHMAMRQTGDMQLTAHWSHIHYILCIHHNYKDDEIEEIPNASGTSFELPLLGREGYETGNYSVTFVGAPRIADVTTTVGIRYIHTGYNTKADGTGIQHAVGTQFVAREDLVLFATWEKQEYGHIILPQASIPPGTQEITLRKHPDFGNEVLVEQHMLRLERINTGWKILEHDKIWEPGQLFLPYSDVILEAVWTDRVIEPKVVLSQLPPVEDFPNEITVTLDAGEGLLPSGQTSEEIVLKNSYTWRQSAWCKSEHGAAPTWSLGQTITLSSDLDIHAVGQYFHKREYVSLPVPTHPSKRFIGWAKEADGPAVYGPHRTFTESDDITLYAVYGDADSHIIEFVAPEGYEFNNFPNIVVVAPGQSAQLPTWEMMPRSSDTVVIDRTFTIRGHWYDEFEYIIKEMYTSYKKSLRCQGKYWKCEATGEIYYKEHIFDSLDHDLVLHMEHQIVSVESALGYPLSYFEVPEGAEMVDGNRLILKDTDGKILDEIVDRCERHTYLERWNTAECWEPDMVSYPKDHWSTFLIAEQDDSIDLYADIIQDQSASTVVLPRPAKRGHTFLGWTKSPDSEDIEPGYITLNSDTVLYAKWHQFEFSGYTPVIPLYMSVEDSLIGEGIIGEMLIGQPLRVVAVPIRNVNAFDGDSWGSGQLYIADGQGGYDSQLGYAELDAMVLM